MKTAPEMAFFKPPDNSAGDQPCRSIAWYAAGDARTVEVNGIRVTIRFVGRRGRRARIAITAPPGSVFVAGETPSNASEPSVSVLPP